jgi:hypothetical protein
MESQQQRIFEFFEDEGPEKWDAATTAAKVEASVHLTNHSPPPEAD